MRPNKIEQRLWIFSVKDRIEEKRVGLIMDALHSCSVLIAVTGGDQPIQVQNQTDLSVIPTLTVSLDSLAMRQQQVMRGLVGL